MFISKEILDGIEDVIGRPKFHMEKSDIDYYMNSLEEITNKVTPGKRIKIGSRDEDDNKYIECGIAANADYIISGDTHLLEMERCGKMEIITARDYLEIVGDAP